MDIVFTHGVQMTGHSGGWGCISKTKRCRMLIIRRDIGLGCGYAMLWCDLDLL